MYDEIKAKKAFVQLRSAMRGVREVWFINKPARAKISKWYEAADMRLCCEYDLERFKHYKEQIMLMPDSTLKTDRLLNNDEMIKWTLDKLEKAKQESTQLYEELKAELGDPTGA